MQELVIVILAGVITGIIILIIEYRTRWFANQKRKSIHPSSKTQRKTKRTLLPRLWARLREKPNWADIVKKARRNLANLYGVHPNEIMVLDWTPTGWWKKNLKLEVRIPTPTSRYGEPVDFYNDYFDELIHYVLVDKDGHILQDDWW